MVDDGVIGYAAMEAEAGGDGMMEAGADGYGMMEAGADGYGMLEAEAGGNCEEAVGYIRLAGAGWVGKGGPTCWVG